MKTIKCESEVLQTILNSNRQFLILLKGQQIVYELLSKCKEEETKIFLELKQSKLYLRAINQKQLKLMMCNYLWQSFDPRCNKIQNYLNQQMFPSQSLTDEIKVFGTEILMLNLIMPFAIDTDKNDVMSLNSNHPVWKKFECITTRKKTQNKLDNLFDKFVQSVMVSLALINDYKRIQVRVKQFQSVLIQYIIFFSRSAAEKGVKDHMVQLKLDTAYQAMNFIELPGVKHLINLGLPKIAINLKFYQLFYPLQFKRLIIKLDKESMRKFQINQLSM